MSSSSTRCRKIRSAIAKAMAEINAERIAAAEGIDAEPCSTSAEIEHGTTFESSSHGNLNSTDKCSKARFKLQGGETTSGLDSTREATDKQKARKKRGWCLLYTESSESDTDVELPAKRGCRMPRTFRSQMNVSTSMPPPQTLLSNLYSELSTSHSFELHDTGATPRGRLEGGGNSVLEQQVLAMLKELTDNVAELKRDFATFTANMQKVMKAYADTSSSPEELAEDISFPLDTTDELSDLEAKLREDANLKQQLIHNFSSIGGASTKECTRRLLRHVFTNRCAKRVNWKGRGGKLALSEMSLSSVIIRAVRMNPLSSAASDAEIETLIKDWLKFAAERDGGRKMRNEKRRSSCPQSDSFKHDFDH